MTHPPCKYKNQVKSLEKTVDRYRKRNLDLQHQLKTLRHKYKVAFDKLAVHETKSPDEKYQNRSDLVSTTEKTFDPFKFHPLELHGLILQHFTGSDLIKASEVSQEWFDLTNHSEQIHKIRLYIDYWKSPTLIQKAKYHKKVMKFKRKYKNVNLDFDADSTESALKALAKLGDEAECLELRQADNNYDDRWLESLAKLKRLVLGEVSEDMLRAIFCSRMDLESLILGPLFSGDSFRIVNLDNFYGQRNLKFLRLDSFNQLETFRTGDLTRMEFELRELYIGDRKDNSDEFANVRDVFYHLLDAQGIYLKELTFFCLSDSRDLLTISTLCPNLESLDFECTWSEDEEPEVLPALVRNLSLKSLSVCKRLPLEHFIMIIEAFPNIETLMFEILTVDHISHVALTELQPNLRLVEYYESDSDNILQSYETMKLEVPGVNQNIAIRRIENSF